MSTMHRDPRRPSQVSCFLAGGGSQPVVHPDRHLEPARRRVPSPRSRSTVPGWTPRRKSPARSGCWIASAPTSGIGCTRARRIWRHSAVISTIWRRSGSAEEVSLAVRLLSEYGDRAALFDTAAPLADQELVARAKQQQFYTVLLADDSPAVGSRKPGRKPAGAAQSVRRCAVRTPGRLQRRGRHHRGRAERRDPGRNHPP